MSLRNNERQWGAVGKFFHWVIALAIIGNGVFGLMMDLAGSPMRKINWLALHKSIGLTVLALILLRIVWRAFDRRPPDEPMPRWQALAAHAMHAVLYVVILAISRRQTRRRRHRMSASTAISILRVGSREFEPAVKRLKSRHA
ncbi:cytochrome b [Rhodanobacter lindaniclasticus]